MELKNITSFKEQDRADLQISDPLTGEPLDFTVTVENPNSQALKKVREKWNQIQHKRGKKGLTVAQSNAFFMELADVGVVNWTGLADDGVSVPYGEEAKKELLEQKWLCKQIGEFIVDDSSFLEKVGK